MNNWYVGVENRKIPCVDKPTLFVEGIFDSHLLMDMAIHHECEHIALGINNSFDIKTTDVHHDPEKLWELMISRIMHKWTKWCSVEFDVQYLEWILEGGWCERNNFVPVICCQMPYVKFTNMNTVLKITDNYKNSLEGVWCHNLVDLISTQGFTHELDLGNKTRD